MQRGVWADRLVRQWMEEQSPGATADLMTYFHGHNALYLQAPPYSLGGAAADLGAYESWLGGAAGAGREPAEVRVRWDGIFASFADAQQLTDVVGGLALGGPPGIGAGLGPQPSLAVESIAIAKELVPRADVRWAL
jgi:hypothetical protein